MNRDEEEVLVVSVARTKGGHTIDILYEILVLGFALLFDPLLQLHCAAMADAVLSFAQLG